MGIWNARGQSNEYDGIWVFNGSNIQGIAWQRHSHVISLILLQQAYARIANAHSKLNQQQEALKFYQKSLSEHRDPAIVKKVQQIGELFGDG